MTDTIATILRNSPRISHTTLGYLAPLLDDGEEVTEAPLPLTEIALLICNCPSYSYAHRH